jgi:hypothetical protein
VRFYSVKGVSAVRVVSAVAACTTATIHLPASVLAVGSSRGERFGVVKFEGLAPCLQEWAVGQWGNLVVPLCVSLAILLQVAHPVQVDKNSAYKCTNSWFLRGTLPLSGCSAAACAATSHLQCCCWGLFSVIHGLLAPLQSNSHMCSSACVTAHRSTNEVTAQAECLELQEEGESCCVCKLQRWAPKLACAAIAKKQGKDIMAGGLCLLDEQWTADS